MKPFHGITFCPTGINDENLSRSISKKIIKLGGLYSKDLTRQVNVLICGSSKDTNKYKFAVRYRYDIVFIGLKAIDVFYQRWLSGDDMKDSLSLLKARYSDQPLTNYYIFIGRVQGHSVEELEKICHSQNCYKCNSTHFVKDVQSKNEHCRVIFIADSLKGTRVEAAQQQGLPIVHYKWLLDCHKRNATLEYDPHYLVSRIASETPFEEIGLGSCECWNKLAPVTACEAKAANVNPLTKFKSQGDKIWEKAMSKAIEKSKSDETYELNANPLLVTENVVNAPVFQNCSFQISQKFPDDHYKILQRVIEQNGGASSESGDYVLIPSNIPYGEIAAQESNTVVTEFFIERCLHYKKLISPPDTWSKPFLMTDNLLLKPSKHLLHSPNSTNSSIRPLQVAITGFHGVELLHLTKILRMMEPMGIRFTDFLNKSTDLLIINLSSLPSIPENHPLWQNKYGDLFNSREVTNLSSNNQVLRNSMKRKVEFVKQSHSIPVVTPSFLFEIFSKSSNLSVKSKETVFLNNINWCIICPRGVKENFVVDIIHRTNSATAKNVSFYNASPSTSSPSIKESRLEFLEKIKQKEAATRQAKKRPKSASELEPNVAQPSQPISSVPIKRPHTECPRDPQLTRSSTWGNLMTNEVENDINQSMEDVNVQSTFDNVDVIVGHTQVTYGTAKTGHDGDVRKLTRKKIKDMGI